MRAACGAMAFRFARVRSGELALAADLWMEETGDASTIIGGARGR